LYFKLKITILLLLADIFMASAGSNLFIISDPIGASIRINGQEITEKTPTLVRDMDEGIHIIELDSKGYAIERKKIEIQGNEVIESRFNLTPEFLTATISDENKNVKNIKINPGTYSIEESTEGIEITPKYPHQGIINGLNIAVPLISGFSVAMTINEVQNPRDEKGFISPFLIATYILNTLLIGTDIGFYIHKGNYLENMTFTMESARTAKEVIEDIYWKGNSKLETGDFNSALEEYEKIINNHKESVYYPLSVYKRGTIKMILFDLNEAERDFKTIVNKMQVAEIYNRSLRKLIEISLRKSDYETVLFYIDNMIATLDYTEKEEIALRRCEILDLRIAEDSGFRSAAIEAWRQQIEDFPDSPNSALYHYSLACNLEEAELHKEAIDELEKINQAMTDLILYEKILQLKRKIENTGSIHPDEL